MKFKSFLITGFVAVLIMSVCLVSCKNKTDEETENYSIVGTWSYTFDTGAGESKTVVLQFDDDNTGFYTVKTKVTATEYIFKYHYDQKTCLGDVTIYVIGMGEEYYDFKVQWYGADKFILYMSDEGPEEDEWETMGTFKRV